MDAFEKFKKTLQLNSTLNTMFICLLVKMLTTLYYTILQYTMLQYTILQCTMLQYTILQCNKIHYLIKIYIIHMTMQCYFTS